VTTGANLEPTARVSSSRLAAKRVHQWWQAASVTAVVALIWLYFTGSAQASVDDHRAMKIRLGWIGVTLACMATALSIRKRLAYQGVWKLATWMSAHIYLGIVSAVAIILHSGFRLGAPLTAGLMIFFWLTIASGLLGLLLSRKLPPLLTEMEENPAIIEDLRAIRAECIGGMLELAQGGSAEFKKVVEGTLLKETVSWRRMLRFYKRRSALSQELPDFRKEFEPALLRLREHEHRAFQRAVEYALRANKANAELFLQRLLRGWLTFHMTTTVAMFGLAGVHILSVYYY
jgi:hypothetical protein